MLVLASLGGSVLGEPGDAPAGKQPDGGAIADAIARIATGNRLVIMHGNGPHMGLLALDERSLRDSRTYPLDVIGTRGSARIGSEFESELARAIPDRPIASLLIETVVDVLDPAFRAPTVAIGERVVAAPLPRSVLETPTIELLLQHDAIVVGMGGGGLPVIVDHSGDRYAVEAVVAEEATAAVLARQLAADVLLFLTNAAAVVRQHGADDGHPIGAISARELASLPAAASSLAPIAAAAASFVLATSTRAAIGSALDAESVLAGTSGTQVYADLTSTVPVRSEP